MKRGGVSGMLLVLSAAARCATTVAPGAEKVRVTTNAKDVEGCRLIGQVDAPGPFNMPNDWKIQLQNATLAAGGDTVFRTGPLAMTKHVSGMAYTCSQP